MLSSSLKIFSQHLIFYPKQWLLNDTCQFLLCKSPGTLPACNMSSVPSFKMCRDFDNHVKQTLSHSCVIRNSLLLKMPWWCWGLHALGSIPPATIRVSTVPTAPSQLHSAAISQLCPWCWESLTPWDQGMLSLLGHTALGHCLPKAHKTMVPCLHASFSHSVFSLKKKSPGSMLPLACLFSFSHPAPPPAPCLWFSSP